MSKYILLNEVPGFKPGDILDPDRGDPVQALRASGNVLVPWSESLQALSDTANVLYRAGIGGSPIFASVMAGYALRKGTKSLLWSPQGGGDVQTWDDVMLAVEASNVPITVLGVAGQTHVIPRNSTPYNVKGLVFEFPLGDANSSIVKIEDGATLDNCYGGVGAFTLEGNSSVSGGFALTWSASDPPIFLQQFGNYLKNSGSELMFSVPDNGFIVLAARQGGGIIPGSGAPVFSLGSLSTGLLTSLLSSFSIAPNAFIGAPTSTVVFQHDGNAVYPAAGLLPGYAGGYVNGPFGKFGGSGPSSFRPVPLFGPLDVGTTYIDTTVATAKPLWFDGVGNWLDVNGVIVP